MNCFFNQSEELQTTSWLPFQDPIVTEDEFNSLLNQLIERVNNFKSRQTNTSLGLSDYECSHSYLAYLLRNHEYNIEKSHQIWVQWIEWRRSNEINVIREGVHVELDSRLAYWSGKDKIGRHCLVITGRILDSNKSQRIRSFQNFVLNLIEEKMKEIITEMDNNNDFKVHTRNDQIVIIYDRRGLTFQNIDPHLQTATRPLIDSLKKFYGGFLGTIYILHANIFMWVLFQFFRPFLLLSNANNRVILLDNPKQLLNYFEKDNLHLLETTSSNILPQSQHDIHNITSGIVNTESMER